MAHEPHWTSTPRLGIDETDSRQSHADPRRRLLCFFPGRPKAPALGRHARVVAAVKLLSGAERQDAFGKQTVTRHRQVDLPHRHHEFYQRAVKAI